jgi:CRP-like cAMP-binding protein
MKHQSSNYQRQPEDKMGTSSRMADKMKNIIHLHEVVSEQPMNSKKTSSLLRPQKTAPERDSDVIAKTLFDDIVSSLNQRNFAKAEQLREKLLAEAPNAVREIVRSGELIEEKKTSSMNPEKIRPWADLFNQFTNSEAMAFYFALKEFVVKPNQPVFQQGNCDNRLYLIGSGSLKLKYFDYDTRKNVLITTLRKGDIAGVETFFMLTNHTTNLIAIEESTISYLDKTAYQKILAGNHAIESKLLKFCDSKQIKYEHTRPEAQARRAHKRYKADLNGDVQRFDQNDRLCEERTEVKIVDISAGGLAYRVRNLKIGEAANLHNSRIHITASYQKYSILYELKRSAKVVSLKFLPFGECSVHVQFEKTMDENIVMEIAKHTDVMAYI